MGIAFERCQRIREYDLNKESSRGDGNTSRGVKPLPP